MIWTSVYVALAHLVECAAWSYVYFHVMFVVLPCIIFDLSVEFIINRLQIVLACSCGTRFHLGTRWMDICLQDCISRQTWASIGMPWAHCAMSKYLLKVCWWGFLDFLKITRNLKDFYPTKFQIPLSYWNTPLPYNKMSIIFYILLVIALKHWCYI